MGTSKFLDTFQNQRLKFQLNIPLFYFTSFSRFFIDGDVRIKEIFEEFDPLETGSIDYLTWSMMLSPKVRVRTHQQHPLFPLVSDIDLSSIFVLKLQNLPEVTKKCRTAGRLSNACPTDEEIELLNAMYDRGRRLAKEASKSGVRLLIDAEQVRYQPAIDNFVLGLQRQFNVGNEPIVYNTYQCYLRDSLERLYTDVARSERFGYHFGAKIVRGAYMEREREFAKSMNMEDPIHRTIAKTHECYDNAVDYLLRHSSRSDLKVEIMCATHNQASIENAIKSMDSYGIDRRASTVCFAQLYGMSDQLVSEAVDTRAQTGPFNLVQQMRQSNTPPNPHSCILHLFFLVSNCGAKKTFNLGKNGYRSYKYLPYGEVNEVIPYLLRRASENSAIVGGATEELNRINAELKRRLMTP